MRSSWLTLVFKASNERELFIAHDAPHVNRMVAELLVLDGF